MEKVDLKNIRENIRFYDTMQKKKVKFVPIKKDRIGMYVCGPTVYDDPHIGHARAAIAFDVIYRFLKYVGYEVTYVRNYTDVDDKIIKKANELSISTDEVSERYIKSYEEAMELLNVEEPTYKPRVTRHIPQIISLIEKILENGHGYVVNGNVYFDVSSFPGYGKLSGRNIEELQSGARVEVDPEKRHPLDFALWKAAKPGEPWWDSPWGKGRPGWHIECSAMSTHYLDAPFDIHGGGIDLVFPHHENEIAQSEAGFKKKFVNYWIHNGHVEINREKMSKSLKNFITVKDAIENFEPEAIRFFLLQTHYRSPINFTEEAIKTTEDNLMGFYQSLEEFNTVTATEEGTLEEFLTALSKKQKRVANDILKAKGEFLGAMADDFHTAKATAVVFQFFTDLNKILKIKDFFARPGGMEFKKEIEDFLDTIRSIFGILMDEPGKFIEKLNLRRLEKRGIQLEYVEKMIAERTEARNSRDWQRADEIRDELKEKGIILEDTPSGTKWRVE